MTGCAKLPETVHSPSLKVDVRYQKNTEEFLVKLSGGVANDNSMTALADVTGSITIVDDSGAQVFSFPLKQEIILPLAMGIIDTEKTIDKAGIEPLIELFKIDREELEKNGETETIYIDEKKIKLSIDTYEKKDIVKILKGNVNENAQ